MLIDGGPLKKRWPGHESIEGACASLFPSCLFEGENCFRGQEDFCMCCWDDWKRRRKRTTKTKSEGEVEGRGYRNLCLALALRTTYQQ